MTNLVRSQISIFTNDQDANLVPEINRRISAQINASKDMAVIGKVLFGLSGKEAILGKKVLGVDSIYPVLLPLQNSLLVCMSLNGVPYRLQDHIFNHIVTIDPMAVVCMDHYDKKSSVIGSRMLVLDDELDTEVFESKIVINPNLVSVPEVFRATQISAYENMISILPWLDYSSEIGDECALEF